MANPVSNIHRLNNNVNINELYSTAGLNESAMQKLTSVVSDGVITEIELRELQSLNIDTAPLMTQVAENGENTENIDEADTQAFRADLTDKQKNYEELIATQGTLLNDIEGHKGEYETAKGTLDKAIDDYFAEQEAAAQEAKKEVQKIINAAARGDFKGEDGTFDRAKFQGAMGGITVGEISMSGIEGAQGAIESIANVLEGLGTELDSVSGQIASLERFYGKLLEVDVQTISIRSGEIIINTGGDAQDFQTGTDGISAADVSKMSKMTDAELTQALEPNGEYNAVFEALKNGNGAEGTRTLTTSEVTGVLRGLIANAGVTSEVNDKDYGEGNKVTLETTKGISLSDAKCAAQKKCEDPYVITIDGKTYQFMQDNKDGKWDKNDILGINDDKNNLFASMKGVDQNGDGKISPEELKKKGIRLVQVENGQLQLNSPEKDFNLNKIDSIDLNSLRKSNENNGETGTFGHFDMKLKDGRTMTGDQTFEEASVLQKMFNGVLDAIDNVKKFFKLDPETAKIFADEAKSYSSDAAVLADMSASAMSQGQNMVADAQKDAASASALDFKNDPEYKVKEENAVISEQPAEEPVADPKEKPLEELK